MEKKQGVRRNEGNKELGKRFNVEINCVYTETNDFAL